ncbi:MAG TPA: thiamine phosphate synthase [Solirubrobacteraceae bacterium]|jgi:thiamine-phosphate pyrophosphorylase|nr:thiamine phosphate synthase [Solirubrobacteraceae bacterium]
MADSGAVSDRRERLRAARLYLVCDAQPDAFLGRALAGGVDIVQLRMKGAADRAVVAAARRLARTCAEHGALFILNDRPDLAVEVGADGVHVGQDDLSVAAARELVGSERLVGLSTHSPAHVDSAAGADYIGVGPVRKTPTKPGRPAVGLELVAHAAAHARVPFFAIGGIDAAGATEVRAAGGRRIAVVRALTEAEDPGQAARELRAAIESPSEASVGAAQS